MRAVRKRDILRLSIDLGSRFSGLRRPNGTLVPRCVHCPGSHRAGSFDFGPSQVMCNSPNPSIYASAAVKGGGRAIGIDGASLLVHRRGDTAGVDAFVDQRQHR